MIPYEDCTFFPDLYRTVGRCFPQATPDSAPDIVRQLAYAPSDDGIYIADSEYTRDEVIDTLRRHINAEDNPEPFAERYNKLLEAALETIKHMNDGYITAQDYQERQEFLYRLGKKEFELYFLLSLMKTQPECDEKKADEINYKIGRLRELRELIEKYTKNESEVNTDFQDYEKAKLIYRILKSLQSLGYGYTLSRKEKQNLGVDHEDDDDLSDDYAFSDWIKRIMLLQLRHEERLEGRASAQNLQDLCSSDDKPGRASTILDDMNGRIAELRGSMQKNI